MKYRNKELQKDAEAWEKECREWEVEDAAMRERLAQIKADTVRKMQERLKEKMENLSGMKYRGVPFFLVSKSFIDQIAKEILEGT